MLSVQGGIIGSKTFGYDANGVARTINANGSLLYLTADAEDRYTRFDFNTGPGAGTAYAYETYNGLGLRVLRHDVWGRNFPQAYDGASPGSALLSSDQTLFTPGLMQQDSGTQHFYQTDALGSVRGFTNNAQAPLGEVYFDAFGLPSVRQGSMPWPLGFAGASGYQTDTDTGLMLLGNRYYDPSIGRFLSPDPSGSGDNWYAYCDNNPLSYVDPEGLDANPSLPPAVVGPDGQLHYPPGTYTDSLGRTVTVGADGRGVTDFGHRTVASSTGLFYPVNVLNDHDFAAVSAVGDGAIFIARNAVTGEWADNLQPHQESGINMVPPGGPFYRGGADITTVDPNQVKIKDGLVQPTHGLSLNKNPEALNKFGGAHRVESIPKGLQIIQRGGNLSHYEITPRVPTALEEFIELLRSVRLTPP